MAANLALDLKILSLTVRGLRSKTQFVKHLLCQYKPDVICLQETNIQDDYTRNTVIYELGVNEETSFFNYPNCKANGTAVIILSSNIKCENVLFFDEGRTTFVDLIQNNCKCTLLNVYVPSVATQRVVYLDSLFLKIHNHLNRNNLIIAGDFNITLNDIDITGIKGHLRIGRPELQSIVTSLRLNDAFRTLYPTKIETTFENKTIQRAARLDRIYTPGHISIASAFHVSSSLNFSDHKAIVTYLSSASNFQQSKSKAAHWKFNDTLLENQGFIAAIKETIQANCYNCNVNNVIHKFDILNETFKKIAIRFACKIEKERNEKLNILNLIIRAAESKTQMKDSEQLHKLRAERDEILSHKYKGAILRSKLPISQENPTKAFLSIESSIQNSRLVKEINDKNGQLVNDLKLVPHVFKDFYKELYSYESCDRLDQDYYLNFTRKLSNEQREVIDQPLSINDLKKALWGMREEGSPGPNGLTVKFYKFFFDDLAPFILNFVQYCFNTGQVSESFKMSYTILLPKEGGSLLEVKNYRPISLLNITFKILTKALANKVAPFLEELVHPDQAAVIRGRSIQHHNHTIRDIISLAKLREDNACILSIDQQKAFDRVSHEWLFKVLENCNFGNNFLRWIKILNHDASSKILLNKMLTPEYKISRGVRQGDVLSPILYILSLEPLLEKIRQDISISGLHIPNKGTQKLLAFADDTNFFTSDCNSVKNIIKAFKCFGNASGSLINVNKTKCMPIGEGLVLDQEIEIESVDELKMLGIYYTNSLNQISTRNWDHIITDIEKKLNRIYYKQATIFGRSILVNTYIEPKLIYPAMTLDPPAQIIKSFKKLIRAFVFKGTLPCIRHVTIIQTKYEGGINLHDIESKIVSFRFKYLYKVADNPENFPLACFFLGNHLTSVFDQNENEFNMEQIPEFYEKMVYNFNAYKIHYTLSNSKTIYYNLVQSKKQPLIDQVKRIDNNTDVLQLFKNIHGNRFTTPVQKQISYRILFGITPTSEGLAKRHNRVFPCKICGQYQETEEHIFFDCVFLRDIKLELIKLLRQPHNTYFDLYNAIFLNTIMQQQNTTELSMLKLAFVAIYKETVWIVRNQTTHKNYRFSENKITSLFHCKVKNLLQAFKEVESVKLYIRN